MIRELIFLVFYPLAGDPVMVAAYDTEADCAEVATIIAADLKPGSIIRCEGEM